MCPRGYRGLHHEWTPEPRDAPRTLVGDDSKGHVFEGESESVLHDVNVYHCQKCGRVVHRECRDPVPECCGVAMPVAVAHVRREDDRQGDCSTEVVVERVQDARIALSSHLEERQGNSARNR